MSEVLVRANNAVTVEDDFGWIDLRVGMEARVPYTPRTAHMIDVGYLDEIESFGPSPAPGDDWLPRPVADPTVGQIPVVSDDNPLVLGWGDAAGAIPDATTTTKGKVELATTGETTTGTDTVRAVTPAGVKAAVDALIAGAPGALNTLDEIAAALNDDANLAATLTTAIALKAPLASPALTGNPTAPTQTPGDNTTKVASTAFVKAGIDAQHTADVSQFLLASAKAAVNGVASLDSSGLVPIAQLPASAASSIRSTTGAPTILATDQAGDFAFDALAGIMYGPLVAGSGLVTGHGWNTGAESSAAIVAIAPNAAQTALMPTGWKVEPFDGAFALQDQVTMVSGTAVSVWVYIAKGTVISNLGFVTSGTAAGTPTHSWMRICDSARLQLANTADQGSLAIATYNVYQRAIAATAAGAASSFTTTYSGKHLIELVVVASSAPKLYGQSSSPVTNQTPGRGGTTNTGLVGPPGYPTTAAALTFIGAPFPYLFAT